MIRIELVTDAFRIDEDSFAIYREGFRLEGTDRRVEPLTVDFVQQAVDRIAGNYPLPDLEIYLLPFVFERLNGSLAPIVGATLLSGAIYMGALDLIGFASREDALKETLKTLAHEVGHAVHRAAGMQTANMKAGLWLNYEAMQGHTFTNSRDDAANEGFAESWRMIFAPDTRHIPHRQGLNWQASGLREWMLSLNGSLVLRPDHAKAYKGGQVIELDKAPRVEDGRTLIPLRYVAELLGHPVHWDGQSIIIS
jgi:hypothetical protein